MKLKAIEELTDDIVLMKVKCLYPVTIQNFYSIACYFIIYLSRLVFIQYFCNRVFININDICHVKRILELINCYFIFQQV